jgi:ferredoxin
MSDSCTARTYAPEQKSSEGASTDTQAAGPPKPVVAEDLCIACGVCSVSCPPSAIGLRSSQEGGRIVVKPTIEDSCIGCGTCVAICPGNALSFDR